MADFAVVHDNLRLYETEQLQAELERRRRRSVDRGAPKPVTNPNWSTVVALCTGYVETIFAANWPQDDSKQYIFEEAVRAVYGPHIWALINERMKHG